QRPGGFFGRRIEDVDRFTGDRAGDDVLPVRCDVGVVDRALRRQRLDALHRRGVDHVDAARRLDDADIHPLAVLADGEIVRMAAERHLLDDLERLAVDDVESAERFVADVDPRAVGRDRGAVIDFDPVDLTDHLVGGRIDDVNVVAGAVGLDDHDFLAGGAHRCGQICAESDRERGCETPAERMRGAHRSSLPVFLTSPTTQALRICHSGSLCEFQCLPPLWKKSPPAFSASGCTSSRLFSLPGITTRFIASKFLRDSSSFHVVPDENGWRRSGVPAMWHEMQRAWPGRFAAKIGCTRVLKYSKSSVAPGGDCPAAVACVARAVRTNDPRVARMACLVIVRRPPLRSGAYEREVTATGYTPCARRATVS